MTAVGTIVIIIFVLVIAGVLGFVIYSAVSKPGRPTSQPLPPPPPSTGGRPWFDFPGSFDVYIEQEQQHRQEMEMEQEHRMRPMRPIFPEMNATEEETQYTHDIANLVHQPEFDFHSPAFRN